MPGTRIVLNAGEPDPDPAPFLFLSAEHKQKNAEKPYDPKRYALHRLTALVIGIWYTDYLPLGPAGSLALTTSSWKV